MFVLYANYHLKSTQEFNMFQLTNLYHQRFKELIHLIDLLYCYLGKRNEKERFTLRLFEMFLMMLLVIRSPAMKSRS